MMPSVQAWCTPFSTDGTKLRSTFWPTSDWVNSTPRVARLGFDAHPDLGELARAAGLLFVAVFGFALALDRLAVFHARLGQFHVDIVTAAQTVGHDFQVQFALRGNDRLVQFRVHRIEKRRVFLVQARPGRRRFCPPRP